MVSDDDPRLRAARYKEGIGTDTGAALMHGTATPDEEVADREAAEAADGSGDETQGQPRLLNADVEVVARTAIDKAIAQGHFDHLAYAGKPLPDIVASDDPDWWTKSLMRREEVHATEGLGPEALLLRVADAELDDQLDALPTEAEVRNAVDGFNRRVIEARRQLLGGPPVVTRTRDVDAQVQAWRTRRAARAEAETRRRAQVSRTEPRKRRRWHRAGR
jgi:hypothetical protein